MARQIGFSSLMDGVELPKGDLHFEVLGALDECAASMAMARSINPDGAVKETLRIMQKDVSCIMGVVAGMASSNCNFDNRLLWIDKTIEEIKASVMGPKGFIVPGENVCEASLDFARTVARRAERALARLAESGVDLDPAALQYLNRISTLLYFYELQARNLAG